MNKSLGQLINEETGFVASISCPSNDKNHPHIDLLTFLKDNFSNCKIACTSRSYHCDSKEHETFFKKLLGQTEDEAKFNGYAFNSDVEILESETGDCMGAYAVTIEENPTIISKGVECSF